ncbi:ribonuclease P protein component [Brachybacterium sp. FME24]|uniref:ribonuclease P protein component n=1 Tax=Brachybacterium sp. FME24 TaxID=2742605 RepID=UPI0018685019|nr:ribonuclease P protein component [Brachybacterium sp. FME24]
MNWSSHRLHTGGEFRAVTRGGARSARSHVVVHLILLPQEGEAPRVGFVVSKKIGNAVVRNRVTRRLREIVRPQFDALPPGATIVMRALPGIDEQPFAELEADVVAALDSATRKFERRRDAARSDSAS